MSIQQALPRTRSLPSEDLAPNDQVRKAIVATRDAGLAYEAADSEKAAADAAIRVAEEVDKAADRAAVAAGQALTAKSAVPEAKDAAELAGRRLDATRDAYRAAFDAFIETITENRTEWMTIAGQQRQDAHDRMRSALQEFARARADHMAARGTIETLEPFVEGFARPWTSFPEARGTERIASGPDFIRDDAINALQGSRRFTITEDQIDRILVELEFLGAGEKPWSNAIGGDVEMASAQW